MAHRGGEFLHLPKLIRENALRVINEHEGYTEAMLKDTELRDEQHVIFTTHHVIGTKEYIVDTLRENNST